MPSQSVKLMQVLSSFLWSEPVKSLGLDDLMNDWQLNFSLRKKLFVTLFFHVQWRSPLCREQVHLYFAFWRLSGQLSEQTFVLLWVEQFTVTPNSKSFSLQPVQLRNS